MHVFVLHTAVMDGGWWKESGEKKKLEFGRNAICFELRARESFSVFGMHDIIKLSKYLDVELPKRTAAYEGECTAVNYEELVHVTLAKLITFNK